MSYIKSYDNVCEFGPWFTLADHIALLVTKISPTGDILRRIPIYDTDHTMYGCKYTAALQTSNVLSTST